MITLGINAAFHDSAAVLVADGVVVAASEEERFSRIKHGKRPLPFSAWELPFNAIDHCLGHAGITLADVDHVAYSFDPDEFPGPHEELGPTIELPLVPTRTPGWENPWDPLFLAYIVNAPRMLVDGAPHHLQGRFAMEGGASPSFRWHFVNHHICHQASAFLAAPFEHCAVMTLDGRGERATTTYGMCTKTGGANGDELAYRTLGSVDVPHSLGLLYEKVTTHLGFLHSSDEYKVMALAALGSPTYGDILRDHIRVGAGGDYRIARLDMERLFGPARRRGATMEQDHLDLAASLQAVLEETVLTLATWLRAVSGESNLAMAGGVALNCVMNSRIRDSGTFDRVWIQPAAGDAGTALGAALWVDSRQRRAPGSDPAPAARSQATPLAPRRWTMDHAYLGPEYGDDAIEQALVWAKLPHRRFADAEEAAAAVAEVLAENKIVGWFQGRMEFGPRALGARSILASPITAEMQQRLNELKDREDFRPVAPVVPREDLAEWFSPARANDGESPFMLFVYDVAPGRAEHIPSACHTDHTARVQTVDPATNPRFHALLKAFGRKTGVPVLVNTSFNVRGEPVVCTPRDAIEAFYSTPLDALAIGSFLVEKQP